MASCPQCQATLSPGSTHCQVCGVTLTDEQSAGTARRAPSQEGHRGSSSPGQPARSGTHAGNGNATATSHGGRDTGTGRGSRQQHARRQRQAERQPQSYGTPTGIKALAGLLGVFGLFQMLLGVLVIDMGGTVSRYGAASAGSTLTLAGVVGLVLGLGYLVVAYGVWGLRSWGWSAGVGTLALGLLLGLVMLGAGGPLALFGMPVQIGALLYLWTKRSLFRGPPVTG